MQTQKMNLANIQGKLSRAEMKNIMAGSGAECAANCNPGFVSIDDCTGTCSAKEDEGVKCGTLKKCCPGFAC